jgi:hypothetical protein
MNIISKLIKFVKYRKNVDKNYKYFNNIYNLKKDNIYRLYTTINLPLKKQEELKNREYLKLKDYDFDDNKTLISDKVEKYLNFEIDNALNDMVNNYIIRVRQDFNNIDLLKYISRPIITRIDTVNVDLIYEYDLLDMRKVFNFNRILLLLSFSTIPLMYIYYNNLIYIPVIIFILLLLLNKILVNRYIV